MLQLNLSFIYLSICILSGGIFKIFFLPKTESWTEFSETITKVSSIGGFFLFISVLSGCAALYAWITLLFF